MKRAIGIAAAVLAGLLAVGALAVVILVKPDRIKAEALERIRASSGYAVTAGEASLTFGWAGVGIRIRDVQAVAPDSSVEASITSLAAFLRLVPLLRKQVELTKLEFDTPAVILRSRESSGEEGVPGGSGQAAGVLAVNRWSIRDGSYRQSGPWGEVSLADLDFEGAFRFRGAEGGSGSAEGTFGGGSFSGALGSWPLPPGKARAEVGVTPSLDSLAVHTLQVSSGELALVLAGGYARREHGWGGGLGGSVAPVDWTALQPLLPPALSDSLRRVTLDGTFAVPELRLAQEPGAPSDVEGSLVIEGLSAKLEGAPAGLTGFDGTLRFARESWVLQGGRGEIAGAPFTLDLAVAGTGPRIATAHVVTSVPGPTLGRLLPTSAGVALTGGSFEVDVTTTSTLPGPKVPDLAGAVRIAGLSGTYRKLPLEAGRGTIRLEGRKAELRDLGARLGRSDFALNATIPDLLEPWATFRLTSQVLDLDELMPPEEAGDASAHGGGAGEGSGMVGLPGEGTFAVGTLITRGQELRDLRGSARLSREGLRLEDLSGSLHGGRVSGDLSMSPSPGGEVWNYEGDLAAEGVRVAALLDPWLPGARFLEGTLQGSMDLSGRAGGDADPRKALNLLGDVRLVDGALANLPALSRLGQYLDLPRAEENRWPFRSLATHVVMRDGALVLEGLRLVQAGLDWELSGRVGADGGLGFSGTLRADPERLKLPDQVAFLTPYLAEEDGRVPLAFKLEGPAVSPRVTLDWEAATARATQRLKEQESRKLQEEIQEKVTDPATLDKLKNLIGGKKSGGG